MAIMLNEFIKKFERMEKIANETLAADPAALVGVNDMPGAEHDAKVPADAKKPDPEVTQGQPSGATSAEGAVNGGDAKPLNEGKLEVNQPLENPDQKPLITDDALTAKEASSNLDKIVGELLNDIKGTQKQAQCGGGDSKPAAKSDSSSGESKKEEGKGDGDKGGEEKKAAPNKPTLELNEEMLSKIAAATATYMAGRNAAEATIKKASEKNVDPTEKQASDKASAIALIKAACIKSAQEAGLDPAAAEDAANNAMAAAGMADAGAAAADAGAAAADAGAAAGDVQIPDDVTEEELGNAIVDLVQSGELDPDTAKALVDEIAGDAGGEGAGITEDQAAEIIADGLASGEITPEQAKEIVSAIEAGAADDAGAAAVDSAEAAGAADAAAAVQDAQDEAKGEADAEAAVKSAAAAIRQQTISKVASAVIKKREHVKEAQAKKEEKSPLLQKVASILQKRKEELDAKAKTAEKQASDKSEKSNAASEDDKYIAGFCKKAMELGVDPKALAKYVLANKAAFSETK